MSSGDHDDLTECGIDWMQLKWICVVEQACGHCTEIRSTHDLGARPMGMQAHNCYRCAQKVITGQDIGPDYHVHAPDETVNGKGAQMIIRPSMLSVAEFKEVHKMFMTAYTEDQESL